MEFDDAPAPWDNAFLLVELAFEYPMVQDCIVAGIFWLEAVIPMEPNSPLIVSGKLVHESLQKPRKASHQVEARYGGARTFSQNWKAAGIVICMANSA